MSCVFPECNLESRSDRHILYLDKIMFLLYLFCINLVYMTFFWEGEGVEMGRVQLYDEGCNRTFLF